MSAYIPPYPLRPEKALAPLALLRTARRSLIAIWPIQTFSLDLFSHRVLRKGVHVLNSPQTVKEAFVDGAAVFERKSSQQRTALRPLIGDGLFISEGTTWRDRRRVIAPITHVSRLPELTASISAGAAGHLSAWRALPNGAEIDALAEMGHLTAGIICATIFGRTLGEKTTKAIVSSFSRYQSLIGQMDILAFLGVPDIVPRLQGLRIRAAARSIHRALDKVMDSILGESDGSGASLLRSMSQAKLADGGQPMDRQAFRNEAAVLFMAGHETTANTLAWAWFILSQDPETERRLHEEVDTVLGNGPAVYDDFPKLPFTRAVIEETLRLYPPVPLQARQAMADTAVGGRAIRKGDLVILNAWLLHRHKKLWSDPDTFLPDRFMPGGSGPPSRYAYVPFSIGPRVCTGAAFGLTEAVLCLATLTRHIRLRLKPDWSVEPVCRLSLRPGERLPMIIEHRP